ncbi:hypothetical protein [Nitrospina watsonii]|nr:hypothetical protein [Nitrospina watsonii]
MKSSPFMKKDGGHALHCALMGHDIHKPCPHYQKRGSGELEIRVPCHQKPVPVSAGVGSGSLVFLPATPPGSAAYDPVSTGIGGSSFQTVSLSFPLKHPPRFL